MSRRPSASPSASYTQDPEDESVQQLSSPSTSRLRDTCNSAERTPIKKSPQPSEFPSFVSFEQSPTVSRRRGPRTSTDSEPLVSLPYRLKNSQNRDSLELPDAGESSRHQSTSRSLLPPIVFASEYQNRAYEDRPLITSDYAAHSTEVNSTEAVPTTYPTTLPGVRSSQEPDTYEQSSSSAAAPLTSDWSSTRSPDSIRDYEKNFRRWAENWSEDDYEFNPGEDFSEVDYEFNPADMSELNQQGSAESQGEQATRPDSDLSMTTDADERMEVEEDENPPSNENNAIRGKTDSKQLGDIRLLTRLIEDAREIDGPDSTWTISPPRNRPSGWDFEIYEDPPEADYLNQPAPRARAFRPVEEDKENVPPGPEFSSEEEEDDDDDLPSVIDWGQVMLLPRDAFGRPIDRDGRPAAPEPAPFGARRPRRRRRALRPLRRDGELFGEEEEE